MQTNGFGMVRFLGFILTRIRNGVTGEPGRMVVFKWSQSGGGWQIFAMEKDMEKRKCTRSR